MTEYDYSDEGYERFRENQRRVGRWARDQPHNPHAFANPFVPTVRESEFYDSDRTGPSSRSSSGGPPSPVEQSSPRHRRSNSLHHRHRDHDDRDHHHRRHDSYDSPRGRAATPPPSPSHSRPRGHHHAPQMPVHSPQPLFPHVRPTSTPPLTAFQTHPRGGMTYLQPPSPGQTVYIIPPGMPGQVEVVKGTHHGPVKYVTHAPNPRIPIPGRPPTPLLKKLFKMGSGSGNSGSGVHTGGKPRRVRAEVY